MKCSIRIWAILITENIGKQHPNESYANKYQNNVGCKYGSI